MICLDIQVFFDWICYFSIVCSIPVTSKQDMCVLFHFWLLCVGYIWYAKVSAHDMGNYSISYWSKIMLAGGIKAWGSGFIKIFVQAFILLSIDIDSQQQLQNVWPVYGQNIAELVYIIL